MATPGKLHCNDFISFEGSSVRIFFSLQSLTRRSSRSSAGRSAGTRPGPYSDLTFCYFSSAVVHRQLGRGHRQWETGFTVHNLRRLLRRCFQRRFGYRNAQDCSALDRPPPVMIPCHGLLLRPSFSLTYKSTWSASHSILSLCRSSCQNACW